ncbi:hypothetical protein IEO21_00748 [Rhodonia placenta]|uniref:RRN7-type domain-containing protein n=1 Tax=Rhodonia placenta TaxID=104341 RepID=A0A8H7PAM2_9APHY|nr:hypothetical protein IEO21_00748 [Postia placenta]
MAPKRRCPVCGSKQWHKEPSSGLITCSEGHVLQNYRNETREVTELGPHALRKRTLKSARKKREKLSKADPNLYHGERARFHYFQCLQLILRMQISALSEAWGLPPEFEIICKDIWALHLSLLPKPPPAEPLRFRQDQETTEASEARARPQSTLAPDDASDGEQEAEELHGDAARASSSSSSASDEEDEDPAIAELMRENSETSSSEEDAPRPRAPTENAKKKRPDRQFDAPASTIAVLIVACWTLRLPVTHMDFIKLIEAYKLPYMDPTRLLPAGLTVHLTKHVVQALSPKHAPSPILLHGLASRLARLMHSEYGVYTPEMNSSPLLWRAVRATCGTPTLYVMSKKVARVLSVPVMLHRSLASPLARTKKRDPEFHKYDSIVPEVALISVVIVVLKMVYGLDGKERQGGPIQDPACALPLLMEFLQCIKEVDEKHEDHFEHTRPLKHRRSALDLDDSAIDRYLDFCETALLSREDQRDGTLAHRLPWSWISE